MDKSTVIKSLAYKFTERFSVKLIGLGISIILARLLAPETFGQLALLMVFTDLSLVVIEGGLNTALVQSREISERDYFTVLIITLALSAFMTVLLYFFAPTIAAYYKSPELIATLRVYSLTLFFSSFNSIQVARFQRDMRFREMMYCGLAATLIAGTSGVLLAYRGAGLWALVAYYFLHIALSCAAMFLTDRWYPHGGFSLDSAKRLYGFGIKMLAASGITAIYNNIRPLIIGKMFSTADLAYYDRGQRFSSTVSLNLDAALQSVMFPVLSKAQDDRLGLRAMLRRAQTMGSFVIFPVMAGMAAVAEPMVRLLLTDKWLPCVIFVQLLCLGEMQVPLTSSNLVIIKAMGRSDILMRQELIRRPLMLAVLLISVFVFKSVTAIACGFLFSAWLDAFVTSVPVKKLLGYGFKEQMLDLKGCLLSTLIMSVAVFAINYISLPLALKLCVQVAVGVIVYTLLCLALKVESMQYLIRLIKGRKAKEEKHDK